MRGSEKSSTAQDGGFCIAHSTLFGYINTHSKCRVTERTNPVAAGTCDLDVNGPPELSILPSLSDAGTSHFPSLGARNSSSWQSLRTLH